MLRTRNLRITEAVRMQLKFITSHISMLVFFDKVSLTKVRKLKRLGKKNVMQNSALRCAVLGSVRGPRIGIRVFDDLPQLPRRAMPIWKYFGPVWLLQ